MPGSIPTSGLVAAWNLTNLAVGVQTIPGAHDTTHDLISGASTGIGGDDPNQVFPYGIELISAGSSDFCHCPTLDNTRLLGPLTIVAVLRSYSPSCPITNKSIFDLSSNTPFVFSMNEGGSPTGVLSFLRSNAGGWRWAFGPLPDHQMHQMYAVTATSNIAVAPVFWINTSKSTGSFGSGSGSGAATGNAQLVRIGSSPAMSASGIYSYLLIYDRVLTDLEMSGVYEYLNALMNGFGYPLSGFVSHIMTSNTAPAPQVASSSSGTAWNVFEYDLPDAWFSATAGTEWVQIDLGASKTPKKLATYTLGVPAGVSTRAPRDWTVSGSNDAVAWTVLDTVANQPVWSDLESRTFAVDTITGPFRYFRITITANNGFVGSYALGEWFLYEYITPSYSGGGLPILGIGS